MKTFILLRNLSLLLALSLFAQTVIAQFETTLGIAAGNEECWDGKPLPSGQYALLSNTFSFGGSGKILLTRLNATGGQNLNVTLHDAALPANDFTARAFELDLNATGTHVGYFITGRRKVSTGGQMTLLRTDLNFNVTWARMLPNPSLDEEGVSVERQSNGDVVATGRSSNPANNTSQIVMARFTAAGGLVWCFRYRSANNLNFKPTEACNGLRPSPNPGGPAIATVAVTGSYSELGQNGYHTFLFLVNASTGTEIYRKTYNSTNAQDEGMDVVYKPAANQFDLAQFMVVGFSGGIHPSVWVVRANAQTGAGAGTVYAAGVYNSGFVARAVTLSNHSSGTRAVLAGTIIGMTKPGNPFFSRSWAMELPFAAAALPAWTRYYEASDPNGVASESINRITGANPGYFISCADHLTGAASYDEHAIRVSNTGTHPLVGDCPQPSLPVTATPMGTELTRPNYKDAVSFWNSLTTVRIVRTLVQESCDGVALDNGADDRSAELQDELPGAAVSSAKIFPNPTNASASARLAVQLPSAQTLAVQVFDLNGKQVFSANRELGEGYGEIELAVQNLPAGAYFVRVQSSDLNMTLKWVINRER